MELIFLIDFKYNIIKKNTLIIYFRHIIIKIHISYKKIILNKSLRLTPHATIGF